MNNKGSSLTISNIKEKNKTLEKNNILTIHNGNDISTIQDKKQFASAIATNDISQSFDLNAPLPVKKIEEQQDDKTQGKTIEKTVEISEENGEKQQGENTSTNTTISQLTGTTQLTGETTSSGIAIDIDKIIEAEHLDINQDAVNKLIDEKKVFDTQQQQQINTTLNTFFVKRDCRDILSARLA